MLDVNSDPHHARNVLLQHQPGYEDEFDLLECGRVILRWRWLIVALSGVAAVIGLVVSIQLPKVYEATAIAIPYNSFPHPIIPGAPALTVDFLISLLKGHAVADRLVAQFDLVKVYQAETPEEASRTLRANTPVGNTREASIMVTVQAGDPALASALANGYLDELSRTVQAIAVEHAGKWGRTLEARLASLKREIAVLGLSPLDKETSDGMPGPAKGEKDSERSLASGALRNAPLNPTATELSPADLLVRIEYLLGRLHATLGVQNAGASAKSAVDLAVRAGPDVLSGFAVWVVNFEEYARLARQLAKVESHLAHGSRILNVVEPAVTPVQPSKPSINTNSLMAGVLGLFLAIVLAFYLEHRSPRQPQKSGDR